MVNTYLALAAALLVVALVVWTRRNRLPQKPPANSNILDAFGLLKRTRFGWGVASSSFTLAPKSRSARS